MYPNTFNQLVFGARFVIQKNESMWQMTIGYDIIRSSVI